MPNCDKPLQPLLDIFPHLGQFRDVLSDRLHGWPIVPVMDWMAQTGRHLSDAHDLTRQLALQLVSANAPIVRLRLSIRTDDENMPEWSAVWQVGQLLEHDRIVRPSVQNNSSYPYSPLSVIDQTQKPYRVRLDRVGFENVNTVPIEVAAQGATDYVSLPLRIASLGLANISLVTDRLGGFTDEDIRKFAVLASVIAPTFEAVILRRHSPLTND